MLGNIDARVHFWTISPQGSVILHGIFWFLTLRSIRFGRSDQKYFSKSTSNIWDNTRRPPPACVLGGRRQPSHLFEVLFEKYFWSERPNLIDLSVKTWKCDAKWRWLVAELFKNGLLRQCCRPLYNFVVSATYCSTLLHKQLRHQLHLAYLLTLSH